LTGAPQLPETGALTSTRIKGPRAGSSLQARRFIHRNCLAIRNQFALHSAMPCAQLTQLNAQKAVKGKAVKAEGNRGF
jgi:hypothetical protein